MNEIERAEVYAERIIEGFERETSPLYKMFTFDYDLACEETLFQELVIQQIRNRGYVVKRKVDEDGLNLLLQHEIKGSESE